VAGLEVAELKEMTMSLTSDLPWPEQADQLRIYRCGDPGVMESSAAELALRFGVPVDNYGAMRSSAETVTYSRGSHEVIIHRRSGGVRFRDLARWQADQGASVDLGDDDAVQIAQAFVARRELASADEVAVAKVTRLRVGLADREGTTAEERVIDVGVVFRRVIDGLPADGPGGHIMVYVGAEDEVTGVDRIWRPIAGVHDEVESLRPREWLDERISRHLGADRTARLDIHEIRLGYFENGWNSAQEFLQPAYVVLGTIRSPDERLRRRSVIAVPAATNNVGEIMPPNPGIRTQPERVSR
jgi:hypothetical protein